MSTPGVFVGQGTGVPIEYQVRRGESAEVDFTMSAAASSGSLLTFSSTNGVLQLATTGTTLVAGVMHENVYDPSTLPALVAQNTFAAGFIKSTTIGSQVTCWTRGRFFVTNVHGSVAFGDFVIPYTGGLYQTSTTTNPILNGSMVCVNGNTASAGAIEVAVNLTF